jgi:hypothetical protein
MRLNVKTGAPLKKPHGRVPVEETAQYRLREERRAQGLSVKTGMPLKKKPNRSLTAEEKREQKRAGSQRYMQRRRARLRAMKEAS